MDSEEPEIGRFNPKGGRNEPNEPFLPDDQFTPSHEPMAPSVDQLKVPQGSLSKENLKTFLLELIPIIDQEQQVSQKDKVALTKKLQSVESALKQSSLPDEIKNTFSQVVQKCVHTMSLHLEPQDRKELLTLLEMLLFKL